MGEWNVIATAHEDGFRRSRELLQRFGPVAGTRYFNVLVLLAEDIPLMLETLRLQAAAQPEVLRALSRVVPVTRRFDFQTPEGFADGARRIALGLAPQLAGKAFHVRMHRRGFKGRLSSPEAERMLDEVILGQLEKVGTPGRISFDRPDAIVAVETLGTEGGLSLWTRAELDAYSFLGLD
jgi:tRNA(Ser,Leu) C12 N-acetylase TAN1